MKRTRRVAALLVAVVLLLPLLVFASGNTLMDNGQLLTSEERVQVEQRLLAAQEKIGFYCGAATTTNARGLETWEYTNNFYNAHELGTGEDKVGVLAMLDMDNREIYIDTHGDRARALFDDDRIEAMLDEIYPYVVDQNYAEAFLAFADEVEKYAALGVTEDTEIYDIDTGESYVYTADPKGVDWGWVAISAGIALGVALLCCGGVFARYRLVFTKDSYPFREKGKLDLTERKDSYLHTTHTTRVIPKASSSGGGGGGSRSSGRGGHGGGGRSF